MNCEAAANISDLYAEGRLTPSRRAQVAAHLKACPACARRLEPSKLGLVAVKPPAGLKERIRKSLSQPAQGVFPAASPFNGEFWPVIASAAVYACLAMILSVMGPGVSSQQYGGLGPIAVERRLP